MSAIVEKAEESLENVAENTIATDESTPTMIDTSKPILVLYCGICTMPVEFCEFGTCADQCKEWLAENHPDATSLAQGVGKLCVSDGTVSR